MKATFNWGIEEGRAKFNPAAAVKVRVKKAPRVRERSLNIDEVSIILRATLDPQSQAIAPRHALARRWVPWICAYTGARVGEITQLRGSDIFVIADVWTLRITPDAGGQKQDQARLVPLHTHLIDQGFLAVAAAAKDAPIFYDPARARGGSSANPQYKKVGERLAAWVRDLGVTDPNVQPNHGWRHLFITLGRTHNMDPEAREAIPGHTSGSEGRKYGEREMPFLFRELEKLPRFEI